MSARETEIDVAFTLLAFPDIAAIWAFDFATPEEYRFAVEMSPYSVKGVVAAHYALLGAFDRDTTGRVLYFSWERPPPFLARRGRRVRVKDHDWFGARRREQLRDSQREARDEQARTDEIARFRELLEQHPDSLDAPVGSSPESGVFRIVEVVRDPFRSARVAPARVLVIDDRESTTDAVARMPADIDVVPTSDGWTALDRMKREHFDLILCAVRFGEWFARDLVKMACDERPGLASRFVFLADPRATSDVSLAPGSTRSRTLMRPLSAERLLALVEETRRPRPEE